MAIHISGEQHHCKMSTICKNAIFFPGFIIYTFFLIFAHLWWVGVLGLGSWIWFLGFGFSVDEVWGLWCGSSGFFGVRALIIKIEE